MKFVERFIRQHSDFKGAYVCLSDNRVCLLTTQVFNNIYSTELSLKSVKKNYRRNSRGTLRQKETKREKRGKREREKKIEKKKRKKKRVKREKSEKREKEEKRREKREKERKVRKGEKKREI